MASDGHIAGIFGEESRKTPVDGKEVHRTEFGYISHLGNMSIEDGLIARKNPGLVK